MLILYLHVAIFFELQHCVILAGRSCQRFTQLIVGFCCWSPSSALGKIVVVYFYKTVGSIDLALLWHCTLGLIIVQSQFLMPHNSEMQCSSLNHLASMLLKLVLQLCLSIPSWCEWLLAPNLQGFSSA